MPETSASADNFQDGHQQEKRDLEMHQQGMKTSDELQPLCALISIRRKKADQCGNNQDRSEHDQPEGKPVEDSAAVRPSHQRLTAGGKNSAEYIHARISATTRAG